jgi:hypothetical protein
MHLQQPENPGNVMFRIPGGGGPAAMTTRKPFPRPTLSRHCFLTQLNPGLGQFSIGCRSAIQGLN